MNAHCPPGARRPLQRVNPVRPPGPGRRYLAGGSAGSPRPAARPPACPGPPCALPAVSSRLPAPSQVQSGVLHARSVLARTFPPTVARQGGERSLGARTGGEPRPRPWAPSRHLGADNAVSGRRSRPTGLDLAAGGGQGTACALGRCHGCGRLVPGQRLGSLAPAGELLPAHGCFSVRL